MTKKFTFIVCLAFILGSFASAQRLDTVRIQMTGMDGTTPISTDDAEQINLEIDKLYDDDLDMGWEGDEFNVVSTGLRFRGVNVPKGAKIDSAFIEIWAHEDEGDLAKITIFAEASNNPVTYDDSNLISLRPRTAASVIWNCSEAWKIWEKYRTPELKTLVQEVVNRPGWAPGNAMAFFLTGQDQGASNDDNARDFESFENVEDPDDGGDGLNHPDRIPKLHIYYSNSVSTKDLEQVHDLKVLPNPAQDGVTKLDLGQFLGETLRISLVDLKGAVIQNWQIPALQNAELPLEINAAVGTYILKVQSEGKVGSVKVVVF